MCTPSSHHIHPRQMIADASNFSDTPVYVISHKIMFDIFHRFDTIVLSNGGKPMIKEYTVKQKLADRNFKKQLKEAISQFADNPNIKRISTNPNCFVIKKSQLGNNMSPFYHDFKSQHKFITDRIKDFNMSAIRNMVGHIVKTGIYRYQNNSYYFHPEVSNQLKRVM
jgi:hypothetical protein